MGQIETTSIPLTFASTPSDERTNDPQLCLCESYVYTVMYEVSYTKKGFRIVVAVSGLLLLHSAWPTLNWPEESRLITNHTYVHAHRQLLQQLYNGSANFDSNLHLPI